MTQPPESQKPPILSYATPSRPRVYRLSPLVVELLSASVGLLGVGMLWFGFASIFFGFASENAGGLTRIVIVGGAVGAFGALCVYVSVKWSSKAGYGVRRE